MRCPVCKTPLWADPFFAPARIHCPRCGAVFKSTVPWGYFRILVLLVIALSLFVIASLPVRNFWALLVLLIGLLFVFRYVPRLIDFQYIPEALQFPERLAGAEQLSLGLEERSRDERQGSARQRLRFWKLLVFLLGAVLIFLVFSVLFRLR